MRLTKASFFIPPRSRLEPGIMSNMNIPHFGPKPEGEYKDRPSVYVLVFNDDKVLLLDVHGKYHFPGGGIEKEEAPEEAVVRETFEEAGCKVSNLQFLGKASKFFPQTEIGAINKIATFFKAKLISIDPSQAIEDDHKVCWLSIDDFKQVGSEWQLWALDIALKENF